MVSCYNFIAESVGDCKVDSFGLSFCQHLMN